MGTGKDSRGEVISSHRYKTRVEESEWLRLVGGRMKGRIWVKLPFELLGAWCDEPIYVCVCGQGTWGWSGIMS